MTQIYVALLAEGVDTWRPVKARHDGDDRYRIISKNEHPEDEQWEFQSGDVVRCKPFVFSGGSSGLVAFEKVAVAERA